MLAPFGAGNPPLTLASPGVILKSATMLGKAKEHLRLTVADENGATQNILWWGGAGEELPPSEGKFDIAYSLRASSFRGQKQVALQFEEFRVVEERPVEIKKREIEIADWRLNIDRLESVKTGALIWAEGSEKVKGKLRFELHPAKEFAIYTTPPSPAELQKAMEIVQPETVYVFAVPPAEEKAEDFLNRLTGLCKYALNNYNGKTQVTKLAAAMASRGSAVEIGLRWLAAGGHLFVTVDEDDVTLSAEKAKGNQYLQRELYIALKGALNETAAYRKYIASQKNIEAIFYPFSTSEKRDPQPATDDSRPATRNSK
jgi:single-stranded-DNA-specific exonuclease